MTTITLERIGDEPPHLVPPGMNGGGQMCEGYWRQFLFCKDKQCVSGAGNTPEEAMEKASKQRNEREEFIQSPARDKIIKLIGNTRGTQEQNDLNRAFAEFLGILP